MLTPTTARTNILTRMGELSNWQVRFLLFSCLCRYSLLDTMHYQVDRGGKIRFGLS